MRTSSWTSWLAAALLAVMIVSCTKEEQESAPPPVPPVDTTNGNIKLIASGTWVNGPYGSVRGSVRIVEQEGKWILSLDSLETNSGPDLHVYLSREVPPIRFIDLGLLRSTRGTQAYAITGTPNLDDYMYVVIHCQQFNHLWGSAMLKR